MSIVAHFMPIPDRLVGTLQSQPGKAEALITEGDLPTVEIDQAWAGIAFVLTGHDEDDGTVLSQAIYGGKPLVENFGTGAIRLLLPHEVGAIADALSRWSDLEFQKRCDISELARADVYPGTWEAGTTCDYLSQNFGKLRDVYHRASSSGDGMLSWLA